MDRRTFNKLAGLGAAQALSVPSAIAHAQGPAEPADPGPMPGPQATARIPARPVRWPTQTYRRLLVDTHVPDWDDELLASFDPVDYVSTIAGAGFQSLMQWCGDHFCAIPDHEGQTGLGNTMKSFSFLLKMCDPALSQHLEVDLQICPEFYAFRWISI